MITIITTMIRIYMRLRIILIATIPVNTVISILQKTQMIPSNHTITTTTIIIMIHMIIRILDINTKYWNSLDCKYILVASLLNFNTPKLKLEFSQCRALTMQKNG